MDNPKRWTAQHTLTGRITSAKPNIQDIPRGPMPPALLRLILMKMDVHKP